MFTASIENFHHVYLKDVFTMKKTEMLENID